MPTDREGPVLVTPEPYLSCDGCKHIRFGEMTGQPYCVQEDVLRTHGVKGDIERGTLATPPWCPLLPKETGE